MNINVLMPVLDTRLDWFREAVDSIIYQNHPNFKMIIVDDNNARGPLTDYLYDLTSRDCCIQIVRKQTNEGIAAALDFGLQYCTGELIVRMDSDDIANPDLLKLHDEYFCQHPDRHICGVQIRLFNEEREWFSAHPSIITKKLAYNLAGHWFINQPGVAYRNSAIKAVGNYGKIPFNLAEDYALWVKFLRAGYTIYNRQEVLIDYRVHPKSFSFAPDRKAPEWHEFLKQQKQLLHE